MAFISEEAARAIAGTSQIALMMLMKTDDGADPPNWVRFWSGAGDLALAANLIDTQGGAYSGLGEMLDFPALQQLINGLAERVEFNMAGVRAADLALVDAQAHTVRDAPVHLALMPLDAQLQPLIDPIWVWEGTADVVRGKRTGSRDGATRVITVSVGSIFTGRRRARFRNFTGPDQRRRSADDAFCDRAGLYNTGTTRKWP